MSYHHQDLLLSEILGQPMIDCTPQSENPLADYIQMLKVNNHGPVFFSIY